MSGPAPPTDVSIVSLLCVQDARMTGIWCTCLQGHVSPAFLHPLSFKMGLWVQADLGKGRGDWNHFLLGAQGRSSGKLLTLRLAGDAGRFQVRRQTKPPFIALSMNSFPSS